MTVRKADVLIEKLGDPGKFQVIAYFCLLGNLIIVSMYFLSMAFFAAKTEHHCKLGSGESVDDFVPMVTNKNGEKQWDGCHVYAGNNTTAIVPCKDGWTYYLGENEVTIISEFDLVCDDAYKADLAGTIFFGGVMVGAFVLGYFADKWGRRPVLGVMLLCCGALNLGCFFAQSYVVFVILRFILGFTSLGVLNTSYVLGLELFPTTYRATGAIFFAMGAVIGGGILALLAYLLKDWRYVQLVLTILPFTQFCMSWFVQESLRWLFLKKKFKQAGAVIKRVVTFNNLPFPDEILNEMKQESHSVKQHGPSQPVKQHKAGYLQLVKNRTLRTRVIILFTVWFTVQMAYYGLAFNISFLFGNKYLNFGISQTVDLFMILLIIWAVPRFGRRHLICFGFFVCGLANIISLITKVVKFDGNSIKVIGTVTALLGKTSAAGSLSLLYIFTTELFPTVIRIVSLGIISVGGRIGVMAAPQILLLGIYTSNAVPYSIIGGLSLLSGFLIFLLPKTRNKPLMDTIEHANEFPRDGKEIVEQGPDYENVIALENLNKPESSELGKLEEPECTPFESNLEGSILVENLDALLLEKQVEAESPQTKLAEHESTSLEKLDEPECFESAEMEFVLVENLNAILLEKLDELESTPLEELDEPKSTILVQAKPESALLEKLDEPKSKLLEKPDQLETSPFKELDQPESTLLEKSNKRETSSLSGKHDGPKSTLLENQDASKCTLLEQLDKPEMKKLEDFTDEGEMGISGFENRDEPETKLLEKQDES